MAQTSIARPVPAPRRLEIQAYAERRLGGGVATAMAAKGGGGRRGDPRTVSRHVVKPFTDAREPGTSRGGPAEWRTPVGVEPTDLPLAHLELVLHGLSGAVYDSDRRGSTAWEESCGRNCTFPVSVPTRTAPAAAPAPGP